MKKNMKYTLIFVLLFLLKFSINTYASEEYYPKGTKVTFITKITGYEIGTKINYYPRFTDITELKNTISIEVNDEEVNYEPIYKNEICNTATGCKVQYIIVKNTNDSSNDGRFEIDSEDGLTFSITFETLDDKAMKKSSIPLSGEIGVVYLNGGHVSYGGGIDEDKDYIKIVKYPVNYYKNYGDNIFEKENILVGEQFNIADIEFDYPQNMEFKEWNTQADGKGISYQVDQEVTMPASALSLYAIWTKKETVEKEKITEKDKNDKAKNNDKKIPKTGNNQLSNSIIIISISLLLILLALKPKNWNS